MWPFHSKDHPLHPSGQRRQTGVSSHDLLPRDWSWALPVLHQYFNQQNLTESTCDCHHFLFTVLVQLKNLSLHITLPFLSHLDFFTALIIFVWPSLGNSLWKSQTDSPQRPFDWQPLKKWHQNADQLTSLPSSEYLVWCSTKWALRGYTNWLNGYYKLKKISSSGYISVARSLLQPMREVVITFLGFS